MGMKKGQPKPTGSGRKKGTPNKFTTEIKEMFSEVLAEEDGKEKLRKMMNSDDFEERKLFWTGAFKMFPKDISVKATGIVEAETRFYSSRPEKERDAVAQKNKKG